MCLQLSVLGKVVVQACSACSCVFFFQAEDGIRYLVRSRGLGDVYKRQYLDNIEVKTGKTPNEFIELAREKGYDKPDVKSSVCLLYTSDAADERSSVDLGGRRFIKKKKRQE